MTASSGGDGFHAGLLEAIAVGPRRLLPRTLELGLVVVVAAGVGFSFSRVFGGADLGLLAVGPALGGVALSAWVTGVRRWSPSGALLAALGVGVVVVTVVTWRTAPTPGALGRALEAVLSAWDQILSAPLPAPDRAELLVVVAAWVWLVAYAAAELVLRVRSVLAPLVPFVVGVSVPLVLGAGGRQASGAVLGCLTVGAVALVLVRTAMTSGRAAAPGDAGPRHAAGGRAAQRLRRRRLVAAVPVVVVAGVAPLALRDQLPLSRSEPRFDPRAELRGAPPDLFNPLVEVGAQRYAPENEELFVARAPAGIEYWRLAVLDTFDGATWRSSATFAPAGSQLPQSVPGADDAEPGAGCDQARPDSRGSTPEVSAGDVGSSGARVRQEITVRELDSPFLPVAGRAVELEGPRVRFDPAGGVVLPEGTVGEGTTYRVESVVVDPSEARLDVAQRDCHGPDASVARRPVPEAGFLADVAIQVTTNGTAGLTGSADIRALRALQNFFADQRRFRLATEPTTGLSLRQLTEFVRAGVEGGPSEGSVEQFAAAYAVMARTLGFATRVVAGYRTDGDPADGRYHVRSQDAFAWTEVKLEGLGWVPFAATPQRPEDAPPPTDVSTTTTSTTLADQGNPTPTTEASGGGPTRERRTGSGGRPWWVVAALVVVVTGGLALLTAPLLRWRRRWRRARHPDVARRIDGAWRELLDRLAAHRVPVTGAMTATEVVDVTGHHLGARLPLDAYELAALVNLARFGPVGQPPAAAAAAWGYADRVAGWVRQHLPRKHRLRAWLDPRSLRHRPA